MIVISSKKFTYNAETRVFSTFASDLDPEWLGRAYNDACDLGFEMFSQKTGRLATFIVNEVVKQEGDIQKWVLTPDSHTEKKIPTLKGTRVEVFND
jgi:hypothetical protein